MSKNESTLVSAVEKWLASVPKNRRNQRTITLVEILLRDLKAGGQGMWGPAILDEFIKAGLPDLPNKELSHQIRNTSAGYISRKGGSFTIASKPYRLVWRDGRKGVAAKRRENGEPPAEARNVSWFWEPFVEKHDRQDRVALIPEPTFHRTKDMTYIRNIDVNTDVPNPPELVRRIAHNGNKPTHLTPVKHYVSTGDVMAFAHVMRLFHKHGKFCALETMDHFTSRHNLPKAPLVVLGSGRTNWLVGQNEERFCLAFRMLRRGVSVDKKGTVFFEDPKPVYDDSTLREGFKPSLRRDFDAYGVATRIRDYDGRPLIQLTANHGRACEAVGEFLVDEARMAELFGRRQVASTDHSRAGTIQVLFRVVIRFIAPNRTNRGESEIQSCTPVAIWKGDPTP